MKRKENLMDFNNASEKTISGLVIATEWDDDDDITDLEISTDDDSYNVEKNALWKELVDLSDTQVEITGVVTEEEEGNKRIFVTSYELLKEMKSDDDEVKYDHVYEEWSYENVEELGWENTDFKF